MVTKISFSALMATGLLALISCDEPTTTFQEKEVFQLTMEVDDTTTPDDSSNTVTGTEDDVLVNGGTDDDSYQSSGSMDATPQQTSAENSELDTGASDDFGQDDDAPTSVNPPQEEGGQGSGTDDDPMTPDDEFLDDIDPDSERDDSSGEPDPSSDSNSDTSSDPNGSDDDGASGSPDSSEPSENDDSSGSSNDDDVPDESAIAACGAQFKGKPKIKFVQYRKVKNPKISSQDIIVLKLNGNQPVLNLNLNGKSGDSVKGICLFLTGNQSTVKIETNIEIRGLVYIARGNQPSLEVETVDQGSITSMYANLSGNNSSLILRGNGNYPCGFVKTAGNSPSFDCQK